MYIVRAMLCWYRQQRTICSCPVSQWYSDQYIRNKIRYYRYKLSLQLSQESRSLGTRSRQEKLQLVHKPNMNIAPDPSSKVPCQKCKHEKFKNRNSHRRTSLLCIIKLPIYFLSQTKLITFFDRISLISFVYSVAHILSKVKMKCSTARLKHADYQLQGSTCYVTRHFLFSLCRHVTFYKTLTSLSTVFKKGPRRSSTTFKVVYRTSLFTHVPCL